MIVHNNISEPWKVTIVDTGLKTMTGGRIKRIKDYIGDETFMLTYGDGVANVDISSIVEFHRHNGKLVTMTAIQPESRYGNIDIDGNGCIRSFREKSQADVGWINGGFMVLEPGVIDYIADDTVIFEREPLEQIAKEGQLMCYRHKGFWQCMDTLRDKERLENLWSTGNAPWKIW